MPARSLVVLAVLAPLALNGAAAAAPTHATSKAKRYSGSGNRKLGTIKLSADSAVSWTASGKRFTLSDRSGKLKIAGKTASGQTFVVRRTYRDVRVRAAGRWTLTFTPLPKPR